MKLFTYASPSHAGMCDRYLLGSTQAFSVQVLRGEQLSEGRFRCPGWGRSTQDRVRKLCEGMEGLDEGEVFVWADADTVLFDLTPDLLRQHLGSHDAAYQHGALKTSLCSGFFVMRRANRTLDFMRAVRDDETAYRREGLTDQRATNRLRGMIDWTVLPSEQFWSIGHLPTEERRWLRSRSAGWRSRLHVTVPQEIRMYHANFMVGVASKSTFIAEVQRVVAQRRNPGEDREEYRRDECGG